MKSIQRILSIFLVFTLLLGCVCFAGTAAPAQPGAVTGLTLTTDGKSKALFLRWDRQADVKGYQIYRSTSGKKGTFERIAVVRGENVFADKDLKASTPYYYKVRAFAKQNGTTVFGPFAKADLSTRITAAYARKLVRRVYQVADEWLHLAWDAGRDEEAPLLLDYTRPEWLDWCFREDRELFYPLNHPTVKTMKQLKALLQKTFTKETVDGITKDCYKEIDGTLYRIIDVVAGEATILYPSKNKVTLKAVSDDRVDLVTQIPATDVIMDTGREVDASFSAKESLYYQNGRWVFGKNTDGDLWVYGLWYINGDTVQE